MKSIEKGTSENYQIVQSALRLAGGLSESARIKGTSISAADRDFILKAREDATLLGMSFNLQNLLEDEGATIVRKAVPA